jgi:hypothetical protein
VQAGGPSRIGFAGDAWLLDRLQNEAGQFNP